MGNVDIDRAAERVALACRALSAAANDLRVARERDGATVGRAVEGLEAETERVCELAQELSGLARKFAPLAA
jgi:hypothetical protein